MKKILNLLVIILLTGITVKAQGYEIKVKIKGAENQSIILGHHKATNSALIPNDTIVTDSKGYGVFSGKQKLQDGMYFIFLTNKSTYFDFLIDQDQTFYVENDTADLFKNLKITGSEENTVFIDYHNFLVDQNIKINDLRTKYSAETDPNKKAEIETQMKEISSEFDKYYEKIVSEYPKMYMTKFLIASREISIPETITDRTAQYNYYKAHYFDNFDLSDKGLFYSPLYENKFEMYLDKVVPPMPDSLNSAVDFLLGKTENDEEMFQYMLIHLFNKYARSQLIIAENVYVHLADIYIKKATWATDSFKNELKTKILRKKNCLIGNKALALHMSIVPNNADAIDMLRDPLEDMKQKGLVIEKDKSRTFDEKIPDLSQLIAEYMSYFKEDIDLYDVKADYTILWFMSPDCSHCIQETPLFYQKYVEELKDKNVVVWCVFLEANTDNWAKFSDLITKWFDFIEEHQMYSDGWYNVWNTFDNHRFKYDISSSPVLYILDKDKKILAKKIGYEQAVEIITQMQQNN